MSIKPPPGPMTGKPATVQVELSAEQVREALQKYAAELAGLGGTSYGYHVRMRGFWIGFSSGNSPVCVDLEPYPNVIPLRRPQ